MKADPAITESFRHVYRFVVDSTPPARDLEHLQPVTVQPAPPARAPSVSGWLIALGAATAVILMVGMMAMLRGPGDDDSDGVGSVLRGPFVQLDDPIGSLGEGTVVAYRQSSEQPAEEGWDAHMIVWTDEPSDRSGAAIGLLRSESGQPLIATFGPSGEWSAESVGDRPATVVDGTGGDGSVWVGFTDRAGDEWLLVAAGVSRTQAIDLAGEVADAGPSAFTVPPSMEQVYEGPQLLTPHNSFTLREIAYAGPSGRLEIATLEGWLISEIGLRFQSDRLEEVELHGTNAYVLRTRSSYGVAWSDGENTSYFVTSDDLGRDRLLELAGRLRSVEAGDWEGIPVAPADEAQGPTANSFAALSDTAALAEGAGSGVYGRLVEDQAGDAGVCAWIERPAGLVDLGCAFDRQGTGYWPVFAVPGGVVLIAQVPIEAVEARLRLDDGASIELVPVRLGDEAPVALLAHLIDSGAATAELTLYDASGGQLDADPQNERMVMTFDLTNPQ